MHNCAFVYCRFCGKRYNNTARSKGRLETHENRCRFLKEFEEAGAVGGMDTVGGLDTVDAEDTVGTVETVDEVGTEGAD